MRWSSLVAFCLVVTLSATDAAGSNSGGISLEEDRLIRPAPPSSLNIETYNGIIIVSWDPVGLEIITGYKVLRKRDEEDLLQVAVIEADPVNELSRQSRYSFEDKDIRKKGTYTYAIVTVDHYGNESDLSEQVEIKFRPDK